jgi:hypothetical protein
LNQDGSKYMRFIAWNQIWLVPANESRKWLRSGYNRNWHWEQALVLCLLNYPKIHDCDTLVSPTFTNGALGSSGTVVCFKPGIFFHDAWNECISFTWKTKFSLTWADRYCRLNGSSRATMASTLNFLTIDSLFLTGR